MNITIYGYTCFPTLTFFSFGKGRTLICWEYSTTWCSKYDIWKLQFNKRETNCSPTRFYPNLTVMQRKCCLKLPVEQKTKLNETAVSLNSIRTQI